MMPFEITYGRDLLTGILRYVRTNRCQWSLKMFGNQNDDLIKARAGNWSPDGIITTEIEALQLLKPDRDGKTPVAVTLELQGNLRRQFDTPFITSIMTDNQTIGHMAGKTLLSKGSIRSFAFVHHRNRALPWSAIRAAAFAKAIAGQCKPLHEFFWGNGKTLAQFLSELPKPAGVFAGNDRLSYDVIAACYEADIHIPHEILLIGVDNDPLFCDSTVPTLSSIALNAEEEGFLAAKELDRLLARKRAARGRNITFPPGTVVERESTFFLKPAAILVRRALDFIRDNATKDINVSDVARRLGVSRSLLDLRFREFQHTSIAAEIRRARFAEVERKLRETDLSLVKIANLCGFPTLSNMIRSFRAHYGLPPGQWRNNEQARQGGKSNLRLLKI